MSNLVTIPNNILQGDFKEAGINTGRFAINTTLGILGIFDVATQMGFSEYVKEDYGQSLGTSGVGPGCYLVLPVLGPSTIRDTAGSIINIFGGDPWYNVSVKNDTRYFNEKDYYISRSSDGINFRAKNIEAFDNLEENAIDFYASVKSLYLQDRKQKILNTKEFRNNSKTVLAYTLDKQNNGTLDSDEKYDERDKKMANGEEKFWTNSVYDIRYTHTNCLLYTSESADE